MEKTHENMHPFSALEETHENMHVFMFSCIKHDVFTLSPFSTLEETHENFHAFMYKTFMFSCIFSIYFPHDIIVEKGPFLHTSQQECTHCHL